MSQCFTTFKTRGMRRRVQCNLQEGHSCRYHQHDFGKWVARVWKLAPGKGLKFRYTAKAGQVLPKYLDPPWTNPDDDAGEITGVKK
jgi:hypothetical protein